MHPDGCGRLWSEYEALFSCVTEAPNRMKEFLRYRENHFDIPAIGQLTSMVGELGIGGVGRRCWSGRYFTRGLTLIYGFGPDDAPAVGEAAR